jgi:hypothetical protein
MYSTCRERSQIVQVSKLFRDVLNEEELWSAIWTLPFNPLLKEFQMAAVSYRDAFRTLAAYKSGKVIPTGKKSRLNHGNDITADASCLLKEEKIVTVCDDGTLHLWHRPTAEKYALLGEHSDEVYRLLNIQGPDGSEYVLSCSKDGTVKKWHPESGMLVHTFRDAERVRALYTLWYAKQNGGTLFASVLLWHTAEGQAPVHGPYVLVWRHCVVGDPCAKPRAVHLLGAGMPTSSTPEANEIPSAHALDTQLLVTNMVIADDCTSAVVGYSLGWVAMWGIADLDAPEMLWSVHLQLSIGMRLQDPAGTPD